MNKRQREKQEEQAQAKNELLDILKPGDTIYCTVRKVGRQGISREIMIFTIKNNQPICLSYLTAKLLGWRQGKSDGVIVAGCGMDMGFHLVNCLGYALHNDGYAFKHRWI